MSSELLSTLIGGTIGVLGTVLGTVITQKGSRFIKESELRQNEYKEKRERLTDVYKSLITIINLYPDESPTDIIELIKYPPNYNLENYDTIFYILDIKLEDYKKNLNDPNIKTEISNINYVKKKLTINKNSYYKAVKEYDSFVESDKTIFDLYASQHVKNRLVIFSVVINNVFIAGRSVRIPDDPNETTIKRCRRELISAMRADIGII